MTIEAKQHVKVFIGSSSEKLDYAEAIASALDREAECEIWTDAFDPSFETLAALLNKLLWADFGVFLLSPDDTLRYRGQSLPSPRDNVVFELGLFIGGLGKNRSIAVIDRGISGVKRPSDLFGFTMLEYDSTKSNAVNATRAASSHIKQVIRIYKQKSIVTKDKSQEDIWVAELIDSAAQGENL